MEATQRTIKGISDKDIIRPLRNFAGTAGRYNKEGERSFVLAIDDDLAEEMKMEGWNVKPPKVKDDDRYPNDRKHTLSVTVRYDKFPPRIYIVTPNDSQSETTPVNPEVLQILDWSEFESVDLILNPRKWKDDFGNTGIKAFVRAAKFKLVVDEF